MPIDPNKLETLFNEAMGMSPSQQATFLNARCAGEPDLLSAVNRLLRAHETSAGFLPEENEAEIIHVGESQEEPGKVLGNYKLLEPIGEGAFAIVWMAAQTEPVRRKVAIKILKSGMDSREIVTRFEAERQALAMMSHPNIASVFDAGTTDNGRPFFVMELVRGVPLTEFCDANSVPAADRIRLFVKICRAIDHAHKQGIVHRDIKPSNILVTLEGGQPAPKIIDFGIAKAMDQDLTDKTLFTRFAQLIGTPVYMSPEQAEMSGQEIDARSDVFSLGVLLYELLTGCTPIEREELRRVAVNEMARLVREREATRPSTRLATLEEGERSMIASRRGLTPRGLSKTLRGDLDWIIIKTLEKDRKRRYQSVSGLAEDLEHYMADMPVSARAPGLSYRFQKYVWRHRRGLRAAIPAVVLGALATYFYFSSPSADSNSGSSIPVPYDKNAIAVLPFENRSNLAEDEFFTDGFHSDLLTQLSRIPGIKAISRASVMPYRDTGKSAQQIGRELGIGTIVEGGVQRLGDVIRINVQLIDVQHDVNLWAETYTREMSAENIFAIQGDIAESIATELEAVLSPNEQESFRKLPTDNLEALEAYFRGKSSPMSRTGQEEAVEWFKRAIELDPKFALAHARIAYVYMNQVWYSGLPVEVQAAKAEPHLKRALDLDPNLGEAYVVLGQITSMRMDFDAAAAAFKRAIELNPNDDRAYTNYALVLNWNTNDYEAALAMIEKSLELQPGQDGLFLQKATILYHLKRYDEGIDLLERVVENDPGLNDGLLWLGRFRIARDRNYAEAIKLGRQAHANQPRDPWPLAFLIETFQTLQDEESQRFWLQRALANYPNSDFVPAFKIELLLLDGKLEEAEQVWFEEWEAGRLLESPVNVTLARRLTDAEYRIGRLDVALARFEKTTPEWFLPAPEIPGFAEIDDYNNQVDCVGLAMVLKQLGSAVQADGLLERLEEKIDPDSYELLAAVGLLQGNEQESLRNLNQMNGSGSATFDRWHGSAIWEPILDLPQAKEFFDLADDHLREHVQSIREMEANDELAQIPSI